LSHDPQHTASSHVVSGQQTGSKIAGVLLAAGQSTRMGPDNKLLMPIDGMPIIRKTAISLIEGGLADLLVVTGHQAEEVQSCLADLPLRFVENTSFASGQAGSIGVAIERILNEGHLAALIALADMPFVTSGLVNAMVANHLDLVAAQGRVTIPMFNGQRGNPVIWGRDFFERLMQLSGDIGGRALLEKHSDAVHEFVWTDDSIHRDIDTPLAYEAAAKDKQGINS